MPFDFPSDLIEASRTCKNLREKLDALPVDELFLADGTPLVRKRPARAYGEAERAEVAKMREERLEAATLVVTHPFWESVPAGERMKARAALKHASGPGSQ